MKTATILLTGATGFLGRHLMPVLCRAGYPVRALVRRPSDHPWLGRYPAAEIIQGDILHPQAVERALAGASQVIHAAGAFRFWGQAEAFERTNVGGTHNLLQAAQTAGIAKFVYISTIAVIGNPDPSRIVDETHPAQPADAYQASKLRAEQAVLESAAKGLPALIVRPGAFYGPLGSYAFNRLFFQDPMRGIVMQMDGGRYVIFPAYVPDVAQGILLALERGRPGEIYNLCGDAITHREAFDVVCAYAHIRVPRLSLPGWMGIFTSRLMEGVATLTRREPFYPLNLRSYVYNYWRVSNEKARRELGFSPTDFKTGAHRTIDWYRAGRPSWIPELECDAVTAAHD